MPVLKQPAGLLPDHLSNGGGLAYSGISEHKSVPVPKQHFLQRELHGNAFRFGRLAMPVSPLGYINLLDRGRDAHRIDVLVMFSMLSLIFEHPPKRWRKPNRLVTASHSKHAEPPLRPIPCLGMAIGYPVFGPRPMRESDDEWRQRHELCHVCRTSQTRDSQHGAQSENQDSHEERRDGPPPAIPAHSPHAAIFLQDASSTRVLPTVTLKAEAFYGTQAPKEL
jgi:hypothetical protein